jgi:processing peptidase subunit alpha
MKASTTLRATLLPEFCRGNRKVSRLANGLRVMSFEDHTAVTGLGFYTRMGPRFESARNAGATAVLESSVLLGNEKRGEAQLCRDLHALGASFRTTADVREMFGFSMNVPRYNVREGLKFLEDAALHPAFDPETVSRAKQSATMKALLADRDSTRMCFDLIHQAAYDGVALGRALWPEAGKIELLTPDILREFHNALVRPADSVLVASGIDDHDGLVANVEALFQFPPKPSRPLEFAKEMGYCGGVRLVHNERAPDSVTKFQEKNLTHVGLCFKGIPLRHPDYYAYTVIQTLLGGGTSFSSGGPGKGMHTKLFREVIMREGWLHGVECVSAWYEHSGLIGLYGQAEHEVADKLVNMMIFQAGTIPARVTEKDVEMAKNQLMSQLVLLAEARDISLDECGKQLLQHDTVTLPEDILKGAEKITLQDIRRVCKEFLNTPPTFVVYGNTNGMPTQEEVSQRVLACHKRFCGA